MENYKVKNMCAYDQIKIEKLANSLLPELLDSGMELRDLIALCHNGATIYCSVYQGEEKAFSSPMDVMKKLSLEEMANLLGAEKNLKAEEHSINESFGEQ